jgi:hypothetical protein
MRERPLKPRTRMSSSETLERRILAEITSGPSDAGPRRSDLPIEAYTQEQLLLCRKLFRSQIVDGGGKDAGLYKVFPLSFRRITLLGKSIETDLIDEFLRSKAFASYSAIPFAHPGSSLALHFYRFLAIFAARHHDSTLRLALRIDAARCLTLAICTGRTPDLDFAKRVGVRRSGVSWYRVLSAGHDTFEQLAFSPPDNTKRAYFLVAAAGAQHVEGFVTNSVVRQLHLHSRSLSCPEQSDRWLRDPPEQAPLLQALRQMRLI